MQSLLGQIAIDSGGFPMRDDADFEKFKDVDLPAFMLPLDAFPEVIPKPDWGDDRKFEDYLDTPVRDFPPLVIAHGYFIDGRHRLWSARQQGSDAIQTIDATKFFGKKFLQQWKFMGRMKKS